MMRIFRSFEDDAQRISSKRYYRPNVEIKNYNVMINGKRFFDQPINNDKCYFTKRSEKIRQTAAGQGNFYTTGSLLNCPYFKESHKTITTDLSNQQALDDNPKAIQYINFTADLGDTRIFFILKKAKETVTYFSQGTVKVNMLYNNLVV